MQFNASFFTFNKCEKTSKDKTCDVSTIEIIHTKLHWQHKSEGTQKHTSIIQSDPLWIIFYNKLITIKSTK